MSRCGTVVTSVSVLSVPGNQSSSCPISMTSSTCCFCLAELTTFAETSESTFIVPVFLNLALLPRLTFMSLVCRSQFLTTLTLFEFWTYIRSLFTSCCVALIGELTSLSSKAKSINNSLNLPSHYSNFSRITCISGFRINWPLKKLVTS